MLEAVDQCQLSQESERTRPDRAGEPVTGTRDKLTDSRERQAVKSVGSTPVQCVDHLVPLCSGTFSFSVLGVGAESGSSSLECVCFDHLSRTKWNVTRSG